ncbi:MAG: amino acid adenylation domain-containing protein [Kangiellaceae bacterium]|nr:amino acid adenylation domain-containing protein [Kangiellaceae bacterium]
MLADLPISYKDFAVADIAQVKTEKYQRQVKHWLERFDGDLPVAQLDTDYPRPPARDFSGATLHTRLDRNELQMLQRLAVAQGCSLFVVLMSAFRVLLAKYGAGNDLTIGTPVSGRYQHQTHGLIGMFVNTLALRDTVENSERFTELLARVKSRTLQDFDNQDYAYEDLIEALDQTHVPDRNPLFDICLVLQNQDMGLSTDGALQDVSFEAGIAKFDLTVFCRVNGEELEVNWEYATALFSSERIERLARHFKQLLKKVAIAPEDKIADIDFFNDLDREQLLDDDTASSFNPVLELSIGELFASQAARKPNAIAAVYGESTLSYTELHNRSNQLAHYIVSQGVEQGDVIALRFESGFDMLIAIFAVLKSGAAYVPLDFANPIERTTGILDDCDAKILLTNSADTLSLTSSLNVIETDQLDLSMESSSDLKQVVGGDDLAYIMYTSGTTGKPKGALIRHKSVIRVIKNTNYLHLDDDDVCLLLSNYAFDGCVPDLYGALLNGGRVVLTNKNDVLDSDKIAKLITQHQVTSMFVTTALFNLLVEQQLEHLASIKNLMFGGEAVSYNHVEEAFNVLGKGRLIHVYGPTETTVFATALVIDKLTPKIKSVPIGYPINQTSLYILDEQYKPVPYGCTGELYIGGEGLALGYLNREELTAERFIDNPFNSGEKIYRTGDLVRRLNDGSVLYVGRIDSQVKIRGFRIELGEIENVLASIPQLSRAIVVDFKQDNRKYLAAYVVARTGQKISQKSLRQKLAESLPEYMIPDSFSFIEDIPLNANGKVDRRRLPAPVLDSLEAYIAPGNQLEADLCDVWQELLGIEKVGVEDNFFRIGGDSISGIQLVSRLRQAGFSLQVKDVFAAPTVSQLACWLKEHKAEVDYEAEQGVLEGSFSLAPSQQNNISRLSMSSGTDSSSLELTDCQAFIIPIESNIEEDVIRTAVIALVQQHDMLRCYFDIDGGVQSFCDNIDKIPRIRKVDVSNYDLSVAEEELLSVEFQNQISDWVSSCDLREAPLWQIGHLTGYVDRKSKLCFVVPNLICDEISTQTIASDLQRLLCGEPLEAKTSSYRQWEQALNKFTKESQTHEAYWRQVCSQPKPKLEIVEEKPLSFEQNYSSDSINMANQGYRTTSKELVLSALAITLKEVCGEKLNSVLLREQDREAIFDSLNFTRTVGCFNRKFPVVLNARQNITDTIIQTKEMLRGIPARGVGFEASSQSSQFFNSDMPVIQVNYLEKNDFNPNVLYLQKTSCFADDAAARSGARENIGLAIDCLLVDGLLKLTIHSYLSQGISQQIYKSFERNLQRVIEHGKQTANIGGEATPSDFDVDSLSISRLQKIQNKLSTNGTQKAANRKRSNKHKMKI